MAYALKESFLTLQGEGAQAGRLAVFLRFSGCNNWSGRAEDRAQGLGDCARWCDTEFVGTDGDGGGRFELSALLDRVRALWPASIDSLVHGPYVVLTGGEPALQVDQALIDGLHAMGARVAIETNGSLPLPEGIDWICVSPKRLMGGQPQPLAVRHGQELKLVWPQPGLDAAALEQLEGLDFEHHFLQPMDSGNPELNERHRASCMEMVRLRPKWRFSLQQHKLLGIR